MTTPPLYDLREVETEQLLGTLKRLWGQNRNGFWSVSRRPRKKWTVSILWARPLILSSAPLFELILWIPISTQVSLPESELQDQAFLLERYAELFESLDPALEQAYLKRLAKHFEKQERWLQHLETLPFVERAVREVRYEQQGLKKGLETLTQALSQARSGPFDRAQKERIDLDFFHLLEHHLERLYEAIFPCWLFLNQRVDKSRNALL